MKLLEFESAYYVGSYLPFTHAWCWNLYLTKVVCQTSSKFSSALNGLESSRTMITNTRWYDSLWGPIHQHHQLGFAWLNHRQCNILSLLLFALPYQPSWLILGVLKLDDQGNGFSDDSTLICYYCSTVHTLVPKRTLTAYWVTQPGANTSNQAIIGPRKIHHRLPLHLLRNIAIRSGRNWNSLENGSGIRTIPPRHFPSWWCGIMFDPWKHSSRCRTSSWTSWS